MMSDYLAWWGTQLASLLPAALQGRQAEASRLTTVAVLSAPGTLPTIIRITGPGAAAQTLAQTLTLTDAPGPLRAALGPGRRTRLRVTLPEGTLLQRDVVLPIAAERAPEQVLQLELDRLTPFRADETFWSCRVTRRDRAQGRLHLRLTLTRREALTPLLDALRAAGGMPVLLEAPSTAGMPIGTRRIELGEAAVAGRRPARHVALALSAALALAVVAVPFIRQSLTLAAIDARIDALTPDVNEAAALRRKLAAASAGGDVMQAERQRLGDPLHALAAVTEALPDDTWLTDLTLRQRQLTLAGRSANAVRLISRLSAEPALRNPAFTAPVTRGEAGRGDLFSVGTELAP